MSQVIYQQQHYTRTQDESVLDCLTRHGVSIPSSCHNGICQSCMMRAVEGEAPPQAQQGLKPTLKAEHYFLSCLCKPDADLEVALPDSECGARTDATVIKRERLNETIMRLRLACDDQFDYQPGQFINLYRADGLVRSYSLASVPEWDEGLELHVQRLSDGRMSRWLHDELKVGDRVQVQGPVGTSFYIAGQPEQPLLLIGTGCGLSPLWGIARQALRLGHTGPIHLYHGSRHREGLYLMNELRALAERHNNVHYTPCVSGEQVTPGIAAGRANDVALAALGSLKGWRVFLCGHPDMVSTTKKKAFLAGASLADIHADPFEFSK